MLDSVTLTTSANVPVLAAIADARREVRVASPFLGPGPMKTLVTTAETASAVSWKLLTRLEVNAVASGHLDLAGLREALAAGVKVRTLPNLHAKVYLTDRPRFGFVGSGNFTGAGMGTVASANVELGMTLDNGQVHEAWRLYGSWWRRARTVTSSLLDQVEQAARLVPRQTAKPVPIDGDPVDFEDEDQVEALLDEARHVQTWLKAVYFNVDPTESWGEEGWFASSKRGRPSFRLGDLIVIYASNLRTCNAIVEVTRTAWEDQEYLRATGARARERARWPWINEVRGRLTVDASSGINLADLGVDVRGLQGGHKRLTLPQFATVARHLAAVGSL